MKSSINNKIRIVLSGGGTGGSVTPLIAVAETLLAKDPAKYSFDWVGTDRGIERVMTLKYPFKYHVISSGKLRRYFSWQNFIDLFNIVIGFFQSLALLKSVKPKLVMSAGAFVSVPLVWAARLLDIPVLIHQQDIRPGLANKLMAPCAKVISVTFEKNVADYGSKAVWTGNPIRREFLVETKEKINNNKPLILVLGGGTGSEAINTLINDSASEILKFAEIIHITGKHNVKAVFDKEPDGYQSYDLLDTSHVAEVMKKADLVVTRAGLGVLSELSYLGKATIIIPIPQSHQEENAKYFGAQDAAIVLAQEYLTNEKFIALLSKVINDPEKIKNLGLKMQKMMKHDANEKILQLIEKFF